MGSRPAPGGGPGFLRRKPEERAPGKKRFFLPGPTFSSLGGPCEGPLFFSAWPAALYLTPVTARPPAGRAGRGGFADGKSSSHPQSPPLGGRTVRGTVRSGPGEATINHRCPSAHTGADEGAIDSPNGAGEGKRRGDRSLLLQGKVGYRIAPSSVPFGDSFPPRGSLWVVQPYTEKRPKSGYADGHRNSPSDRNNAPHHAKTSEWERAGHKNGGPGGLPPALFSPHFSGEMGTPAGQAGPRGAAPRGTGKAPTTQRVCSTLPRPRPGPGGNPPRGTHPAPVQTRTTCRQQSPPPLSKLALSCPECQGLQFGHNIQKTSSQNGGILTA